MDAGGADCASVPCGSAALMGTGCEGFLGASAVRWLRAGLSLLFDTILSERSSDFRLLRDIAKAQKHVHLCHDSECHHPGQRSRTEHSFCTIRKCAPPKHRPRSPRMVGAPNISILIPELRHVEANDSFQNFARRHVAPRRLRIEFCMANLPGTCLWRQESCITSRRPLRLDRLPKPPAPRSSPLGPLTSPPLHQAGGWPDRPASAQTRRRRALSWLSNRNLCDGGHILRDVPQIV